MVGVDESPQSDGVFQCGCFVAFLVAWPPFVHERFESIHLVAGEGELCIAGAGGVCGAAEEEAAPWFLRLGGGDDGVGVPLEFVGCGWPPGGGGGRCVGDECVPHFFGVCRLVHRLGDDAEFFYR